MQYPQILALIDSQLDRLQEARELLASLPLSTSIEAPRQQQSLVSSGVSSTVLAVSDAAMIDVKQPLAARDQPPARRQRRAYRATPRSSAAISTKTNALSRPADLRPVFVPAKRSGQTAQESSATAPAKEKAPENPAQELLTAERLARRWLQSPGL